MQTSEPAAGDPVKVVFRKYDDALHWHYWGQYLGADRHGRWIGTPAGTPMQRGHEVRIEMATAGVVLLPHHGWWVASINVAPHETEIYCDVTTRPRWPAPGLVTMIDLDLDVVLTRDGRCWIDDEDEFEEHQTRYGYTGEVVAAARQAADTLLPLVRAHAEPFGATGLGWAERIDHTAPVRDCAKDYSSR